MIDDFSDGLVLFGSKTSNKCWNHGSDAVLCYQLAVIYISISDHNADAEYEI